MSDDRDWSTLLAFDQIMCPGRICPRCHTDQLEQNGPGCPECEPVWHADAVDDRQAWVRTLADGDRIDLIRLWSTS